MIEALMKMLCRGIRSTDFQEQITFFRIEFSFVASDKIPRYELVAADQAVARYALFLRWTSMHG